MGPSRNSSKAIFHAVRRGWDGSKVYESLEEAERAIAGLPTASLRSYQLKWRADNWVLKDPCSGPKHPKVASEDCVPSASEVAQTYHFYRVNGFLKPGVTLERVLASLSDPPTVLQSSPTEESDSISDFGSDTGNLSEYNPLLTPDPTPTPAIAPPPLPKQPVLYSDFQPLGGSPTKAPNESMQSPIILSPEQQEVLQRVKTGQNVFFTGSAGTGKSVLLREIIKWCDGNDVRLAVTASTGIAAVNIGGSTLHSFAGVGLGKEDKEELVDKILGKRNHLKRKREQKRVEEGLPPDSDDGYWSDRPCWPRLVKKWKETDALIIDEISMVDGKFFDKLEYIARCLRKSHEPFGGIQLIVCGDFCQLPPVPEEQDDEPIPSTFAFDANSWDLCMSPPIVLMKVFRQKDQEFVDLLNALRFALVTPEIIATMDRLRRRVTYKDGLQPTELYPRRADVEISNTFKLKRIKSEAHDYKAKDLAGWDQEKGQPVPKERMERLLSRLVAPESLTLKEGAQVMLIKNIIQGSLVNGTIGMVVGFMTTREAADRGYMMAVPALDVSEEEERMKIRMTNWRKRSRTSYDPVDESLDKFAKDSCKYPLVHFPTANAHLLCVPNIFDVKNAKGHTEASREQVPLILAWALSIHKSQGQTLQRVRVDLGTAFEKGQAYVALSRAVSLDTLEVSSFDATKVKIHPRVMQWARIYMPQAIPPELR